MSSSNSCFLTCIQISQETGSSLVFPSLEESQFVVIHTVKGFSVVNDAEVDAFLEFSCFFYVPTVVGNLTSSSPVFSKSNLCIQKLSVHLLLKTSLKDFEHYFASMWNECNCVVVWTFFDTALLWDCMKSDLFQSCGHCCVFQICCHIDWLLHFNTVIF